MQLEQSVLAISLVRIGVSLIDQTVMTFPLLHFVLQAHKDPLHNSHPASKKLKYSKQPYTTPPTGQ